MSAWRDQLGSDRFAAVVSFGVGPVRASPGSGQGLLDPHGRINALAAGKIWEVLPGEPALILTGGHTGGQDLPSEARLMADVILKHCRLVPRAAIQLEEAATNTILNFAYVANILDRHGLGNQPLVLVAMAYHLSRVRDLATLMGMSGQFIESEDVVRELHPGYIDALVAPDSDHALRAAQQVHWLHCQQTIPQYWLPQTAEIESDERLLQVLRAPRVADFLVQEGVNLDQMTPTELRVWLRSLERIMPPYPTA